MMHEDDKFAVLPVWYMEYHHVKHINLEMFHTLIYQSLETIGYLLRFLCYDGEKKHTDTPTTSLQPQKCLIYV